MREYYQRMNQMPAMPQPEAKPADAKPKEGEKKDDKAAAPKPPPGPTPVTRTPAVENSASLNSQRLTVDDKRLVSFNFDDAPWTFVLEEVARVSNMNLDWTQLPGDSLNLRSAGKYTAAQARDIINQHLMARGYAMLADPKTSSLTVVNLDTLNSALVPRVSVEDLDKLPPHDLVKVSFRLDWLLADKAVEEFKQMLSPKGKLLALKSTNRMEAIDAVENLRQLADVIDEEQGGPNGSRLVQEYDLRYTRAAEVLDQLQNFLGIKKDAAPKTPQEAQAQMMMRGMPQPGQPGQPPGGMAPGMPPKPDVRLMANQRRNSILVNAPPDQMAIIKGAIWKIDVPSERMGVAESAQTYRLATLDPELVVALLESTGNLDPQTKIDVDKKNRAIIAYANPRDHKAIASLVKNLDGSDRDLDVIQLRKLDAIDVAGTLRALLVPPDENTNTNNNNNYGGYSRRRFSGWFDSMSSQTNNEDARNGKFRVEADGVNNRLIVWSNQIEHEQVMQCLAKLGEIPRRERGHDTMRVLDLGAGGNDQELLERIRRVWPSLGKDPSKLIIDVPAKPDDDSGETPQGNKRSKVNEKKTEPAPAEGQPKRPAAPANVPASAEGTNHSVSPSGGPSASLRRGTIRFAALRRDSSPLAAADSQGKETPEATAGDSNTQPAEGTRGSSSRIEKDSAASDVPSPAASRRGHRGRSKGTEEADPTSAADAPVIITRGADGRLIISSRDTQALDALEELIAKMAPPRKDYEVFSLKYTTAYSMKDNLDEFFEVNKKETNNNRRPYWYWDNDDNNKKDDTPRLSQRKPMRIIADPSTNTLLVQGATSEQLRRIGELIKLYDVPEPENSKVSRMTRPFPIKHSRASIIGDVIKDVYRDLLSANDKALESFNESKNKGRRTEYYGGWGNETSDDGKINQGKFKGLLSVGIDETSNTLLISCPENLMKSVEQIIQYLDKAAVPAAQTFQVLKIDRSIDAGAIQKKLAEMLKKPAPKNEQQPQQQKQARKRGRGQQNNEDNSSDNNKDND
jgi:type II secretory pathway component GspD/PulD (secretin)